MEAPVSQQMSHADDGHQLQTGLTTADGTTPYSYTDPEFQSPAAGGGNGYPASFPQYSAEPPPSSYHPDSGWLGASGLGYNSEEDAWSQSDISLVGPEESLMDENGTNPSETLKKFSRDDKLRMLALRRHLDNLDCQLRDQEDIVDTTREELDKSRTSLEALTLERDHVMIQLDICQRDGHSANMYRLQSKLDKLAKELGAEAILEAQIMERLDKAELQLSRFDLERGKYLLEEEELGKKEADLELERKANAARRAQKESKYLSQAEQRRKIRDRDHIEALMEHDRKHREAVNAAKKSQEVASQYLKQSLARYRQEEADEFKGKKPAKKPAQKSAGKNKGGKGSAGLTRPRSVVPPKADELDPTSGDYAAGKASLLRQFEGDFRSYSIPCYVASGMTANPGTLPYDVHNTLFLEVHCPAVRPSLVVISNHGRSVVDFSEVSVGQRVIKSITVQNVSPEAVNLQSSVLDTGGPFLMLNALRSLAPDETHTILVAFEPMKANLFYEVLDVKSGEHTLGITLRGHGLMPEVKLSLADDRLDMGYVIAGEEAEETFKLENMSSFAIDYRILLDSLSYQKQLSQRELPVFIKRDNKNVVGPANYDGRSVFDCTPSDGTLQPGKKVEVRVFFRPDHASGLFSDMARVQLFGKQEAHAIHLKGAAKTKVMFLEGLDEIYPTVESLTLLPAPEEEEVVDPKAVPPSIPMLLSFKALSVDKEIKPATRQLHIGCIKSTAPTQKKNGEFFFDNAAALSVQGFQVEPQRGMVEAGNTKPVTFTWTPPKGHDPNLPIESSIIINLKGDILERYNILLRALVVSE
nr:cilia- and flagella-associated protein 74-like [Lytechinus pictus]